MYPKVVKTGTQANAGTFIGLVTMSQKREELRYPSPGKWMNIMWYIAQLNIIQP